MVIGKFWHAGITKKALMVGYKKSVDPEPAVRSFTQAVFRENGGVS